MRIVIMGAGMAGLSAALGLARAGHQITLLERDSVFQDCGWETALQRSRDGIAHFLLSVVPAKDQESQMLNYIARILPEVRERFALPCELDAVRIRAWQGDRIDFMHRAGCYPQFMWVGAAAVALQDGEVCRKTLRRIGMLDRLSVFDKDIALQQRVEELLTRASMSPPPPLGPSRAELTRVAAESMVRTNAKQATGGRTSCERDLNE